MWIDPDDIDGAANSTLTSGGAIGTIVNKGTLGGTFAGQTGARPTFEPTAGAGGGPAMRFGSGASLAPYGMESSLPASSFSFMHDGTGCTIYSVVKQPAAHVGTIVATSTGAGTNRGVGHRVNTFFRASYYMSDGSVLRVTANSSSAEAIFSGGQHHIFSTRLANSPSGSDAEAHVDSALVFGVTSAAFSSADPASTLRLGRTSTDGNRLVGDLGDLLIYAGWHDDTERAAVEAWLTAQRGAFPQ